MRFVMFAEVVSLFCIISKPFDVIETPFEVRTLRIGSE